MRSPNCSGMGNSSSGSPARDFVVVPSSAGGKSSFEQNSQSTEGRATLDRYHHFHGLPVTYSLLIPALRGLYEKGKVSYRRV